MLDEVNEGRKHIRNIQMCENTNGGEFNAALAQEGATPPETSVGSQNQIYLQRYRARLSELYRKPVLSPSLNGAHRPCTGTEWHLVSRHTPTPANQHTA